MNTRAFRVRKPVALALTDCVSNAYFLDARRRVHPLAER